MATSKVTFTLDEETVRKISDAAEILHKPKSQIVREAVSQYRERMGKLSERERVRMLRALDRIAAEPPTRPQHEVEKELREIRRSRREAYPRAWERKYKSR
jgi:predicted transcriptional regulator